MYRYRHREDLRDNMWRNPGETGTDDRGRNKATNGIDDDGLRWPSRMSFPVSAGSSYSVAVLGWGSTVLGAIGPFTLRWYPTPLPQVTAFSPASVYPGQKVTFNGTNFLSVTRVLSTRLTNGVRYS